jgi:two-component system nitrogen regulation response regulator GlnG
MRERRQDIPLLLRHFLSEASLELNVETKSLLPEVEDYLCQLDWPGNVRQLENTCRWITVMAAGKEVHLDDLPPELLQTKPEAAVFAETWEQSFRQWVDNRLRRGEFNVAKDAIDSAEGILICTALQFTRGRRQEAAKLLGYGRNTLTRKINELNLDV